MIKLVDILNEGVYDPGIFKAVFTAGGPGSGKSYAASTLFGMPEKMPFVSAQGLKGVNTDKAFEVLLNKAGLGTNLSNMNPDQYKKSQEIRTVAKRVVVKQTLNYINGKLGMLIDGTGHNANKISKKKKMLEGLGYDCFMVFVNTNLKVALKRNANRERVLPEDVVKEYWTDCQQNLGKFQSMFGASNMLIVDNSKYQAFAKEVMKAASKFVRTPIQNPIAKDWIKMELKLRKSK
jgi:predicted kinase